MAKKRRFGQQSGGQGKKPARGIREFESNRGALAQGIGNLMREMRLQDLAVDIIRQNKLATSSGGRAILRLGLQKAFLQGLWKTGRMGDIASEREKAMFQLIANAETIRSAVWRAFTERTSIEKTEKVFSAVVQIMQKALSEFRVSKPGIRRHLETIEANARANLSTLRRETVLGGQGHAESLNERQLLWAAQIGEKMIEKLAEKLPADSKTGRALIENIVKTELGEKRND